jgi:hypothetical protein
MVIGRRFSLFVSQRAARIDACRSACGNIARYERNDDQQCRHADVRRCIVEAYADEQAREQLRDRQRSKQSNPDASADQDDGLGQHHRENFPAISAQGHEHANFVSPPARGIRDDSVHSHEQWLTLIRNHREAIAAMDCFTVPMSASLFYICGSPKLQSSPTTVRS